MSLGREARGAVPCVGCRGPGADPLRACCVQGYPQMMPQVNTTRGMEARRPRPPGMQARTAVLCNRVGESHFALLLVPPPWCTSAQRCFLSQRAFVPAPPAHPHPHQHPHPPRLLLRMWPFFRQFARPADPQTHGPPPRARLCWPRQSLTQLLQMLAQGGYPQPGAMPPGYPPYPYPMMGAYPQPVAGGKGKAAAGEPATKGRKRRKRIPQGGPKKPATSFVLFSNTVREQVKQDNQGLSFLDLGRKLGEMWREMDPNVSFPFPLHVAPSRQPHPSAVSAFSCRISRKNCPAPHVPSLYTNISIQVADRCLKCSNI
jgi:hypothetical protein